MLYKFKTVEIANKLFYKIMSVIELLLLLSFIPVIYWEVYFFFLFIFPACVITGYIFNKYTVYNFDEDLCFNEDAINVGDIIYDYISIDKIVIKVGSVAGDAEGVALQISFLPPIISAGTDNCIEIIHKGEKRKYKILCETNHDYDNLKAIGTFLKEQGIHVKISVSLR